MKKLFIMVLFTSSLGFAKGHDCQALCIVLDSSDSTLYFLDELRVVSGTNRQETHLMLRKDCQRLARKRGFSYASLLVDSLDFKSSRADENESSYSSSASGDQWISVGAARAFNRRSGMVYGDYYLGAGGSYEGSSSSYDRSFRDRKLEMRLAPSQANVACVEDEEVTSGEVPYTGGIVVY